MPWTTSQVTPVIGLPAASSCANWISSGYIDGDMMNDDADLAPVAGDAGLPLGVR